MDADHIIITKIDAKILSRTGKPLEHLQTSDSGPGSDRRYLIGAAVLHNETQDCWDMLPCVADRLPKDLKINVKRLRNG